jgi:hypothetical protein
MSLVAKNNGLCLEPVDQDDDLPAFKPRRRGQSVQAENPGLWGLTKKYQQAWNSKNIEDLVALFEEKGDIINQGGLKATGTEELTQLFTREFSVEESVGGVSLAESEYTIKIYSLKTLSPELAMIDWDCTVENLLDSQQALMPPRSHTAMAVCKRDTATNEWTFVSMRGHRLRNLQ